MNLNIFNNIYLYLIKTALLIGFLFSQETLISWEVADPTLNRKFIETYLNKIIANDKFDLHRIPGKLRYHKTLIFGKVEVEQLKYITVMMDLMSRGKWR